jgi:hypothetical protein
VEELSTVAAGNLEEYFRTHPKAEVRAAQIKQLIAERGWPATKERDLRIEYIHLSERTAAAFAAYDYPKTIALGTRSIAQQPEQPATLGYLYNANMYSGNFAAAADAAERLVAIQPQEIQHVQDLAYALAAEGDSARAISEFNRVTSAGPPKFESDSERQAFQFQVQMELAGLQLFAGQNGPLDNLTAEFTTVAAGDEKTREQLSALKVQELLQAAGEWYYRAAKYEKALDALMAARQVGLGRSDLTSMIGFCAMRLGRMFVAQTEFDRATDVPATRAGKAVMYWRTGSKDSAIENLSFMGSDPKWKNKAWVSFAYGPDIFQTLNDIRAERDRRIEEQKAKSRMR